MDILPCNSTIYKAPPTAQGQWVSAYYNRKDFIYEDNSQTPMWQYMLEYFADRYTQIAKENLNTNVLEARILYSIRLYCYGTLGMTREWVLNDNITPAKTAVQMMFDAMPET